MTARDRGCCIGPVSHDENAWVMKPPQSDPAPRRRPKKFYDWLQKIHTPNTITDRFLQEGLYSSRVLIHLKETVMRAEVITLLSCIWAWIGRGARYTSRLLRWLLKKQIRAGARSGSLRSGTNTNHENTPSLLIPCMYSSDLLSASQRSTGEIHKALSQSH